MEHALLRPPTQIHPSPPPKPSTYIDAEERGHAVQVVGVVGHGQHLGDDGGMGPVLAKLLHKLLEVAGSCLSDGVDWGRQGEEQEASTDQVRQKSAHWST